MHSPRKRSLGSGGGSTHVRAPALLRSAQLRFGFVDGKLSRQKVPSFSRDDCHPLAADV